MPEVLPFKIFRCLIMSEHFETSEDRYKEEWTDLTRSVMKTKIKSNQINQSWVLHTFTLASTHKPTQHAQQIASKFCHSHIVYILHIFNFPRPRSGRARPRRGRAFKLLTPIKQAQPVAVRSLGKRADLSPAALWSNSTLAMPLVNQLNSLKTATEFATSQGCGRCGSANLPASVHGL